MSVEVQIPAEKLAALELLTPGIEKLLFAEISYKLKLSHSITETSRNFIDMNLLN
jgi:hypothetical protein